MSDTCENSEATIFIGSGYRPYECERNGFSYETQVMPKAEANELFNELIKSRDKSVVIFDKYNCLVSIPEHQMKVAVIMMMPVGEI